MAFRRMGSWTTEQLKNLLTVHPLFKDLTKRDLYSILNISQQKLFDLYTNDTPVRNIEQATNATISDNTYTFDYTTGEQMYIFSYDQDDLEKLRPSAFMLSTLKGLLDEHTVFESFPGADLTRIANVAIQNIANIRNRASNYPYELSYEADRTKVIDLNFELLFNAPFSTPLGAQKFLDVNALFNYSLNFIGPLTIQETFKTSNFGLGFTYTIVDGDPVIPPTQHVFSKDLFIDFDMGYLTWGTAVETFDLDEVGRPIFGLTPSWAIFDLNTQDTTSLFGLSLGYAYIGTQTTNSYESLFGLAMTYNITTLNNRTKTVEALLNTVLYNQTYGNTPQSTESRVGLTVTYAIT